LNTCSVMGIPFAAESLESLTSLALAHIKNGKQGYVVTPNAEIAYLAEKDAAFKETIASAAFVLPDGIGVIRAAKILGLPLTEKVAGFDFGKSLASEMAKEELRLFLLGAKPGIAEKAAEMLREEYPGLIIAGTADGYFKEDGEVLEKINAAKPHVVFACLGAPKQEYWMKKNIGKTQVNLMVGLGGSLDGYAGEVKRAPGLFIALGLEWLYRLLLQPKRLGRMLVIPKYLRMAKKLRKQEKKEGR